MDLDLEDLPSLDSKTNTVKVCCCQSDIPHDESIKFILTGDEIAMNTPLFNQKKEGDLILE